MYPAQNNRKKFFFFELMFLLFGGLTFTAVYLAHSLPKTNLTLLAPIFNVGAQPIAETVWFPQDQVLGSRTPSTLKPPDIVAEAAFFIDPDSGDVLYQKNEHERLPIASLTKVMTAVITMENKKMTDTLQVSDYASSMEPDTMYLKAGERLSVQELLDGVFLVSANDAAETLAEGVLGDRSKFIEQMNEKSQMIGMKDTLFVNPTGLIEDYPSPYKRPEQKPYSSAYDVALMARYAIKKWPELVDISSQPEIDLPSSDTHRAYYLSSGINLITTYKGVLGFKIGYTPEAGLCIVTYAKRGGKEVLGVLLNAPDRRDATRAMLDYSFKKLGVAI